MILRYKPTLARLAIIVGFASLVGTSSVKAQAWADPNYAFRRPLTVTNPTTRAYAAGDIVAFTYAPGTGQLANSRADGKDVKIYYNGGTTNVLPPQTQMDLGGAESKILFELQAPITPAPPPLSENQSAGTTPWADILAATPESTRVVFTDVHYANDDAQSNFTLPFAFPFKYGTTTTLGVAVDGYVQPGGYVGTSYLRYSIDAPAGFARANVIGPWCADLGIYPDAGFESRGVFFTADATRAIIRWKATDTADTSGVDMNFAVILKPDGTIRFVYGPQVDPAAGQTVKVGVGVGDSTMSIVNSVTTSYAAHTDIAYTQAFSGVASTGYWAYYGYTQDDGRTGRTVPSKVQLADFSDGTLHGWQSLQNPAGTGGATADVRINSDPAFGNELRLDNSLYHHPFAFWSTMTPVGDGVSYSKIRTNGEYGVVQRFGTQTLTSSLPAIGDYLTGDGNGTGVVFSSFGGVLAMPIDSTIQATEEGTTGKRHPGPDALGGETPYQQTDFNTYQYQIIATQDDSVSGHTFVKGKAWPSATPSIPVETADWLVNRDTVGKNANQPMAAGRLAVTNYSTTTYVKWIVMVGSLGTEGTTGALGTEERNPTGASIQGTVRDLTYRVPQVGLKVTFTDASGHYLAGTTTNANGAYVVYFPTAGTFGVGALGGGRSARATVTVAPGTTVTQNLLVDVVANGDCEIPTPDNSWPDQWETYQFSAGGAATVQALSNEQNHTPGGHWSLKIQGVMGDSDSFQTGIGRTGNNLFQHPILPGCSYTLSAWVYFTNAGDKVRFRLRNNWPIAGFYVTAGAAPDPLNENTGGLDGSGNVPVGQWYQMKRTWTYLPGGTANPLPIEYGIYTFKAQVGSVYIDDVTLTPTVVSLNMVIGQIVDTLGNPVPHAYMGEMRYNNTLFSMPAPSDENGIVRLVTTNSTPISVAAWKGPASRVPTGISPSGALVGVASAAVSPVPYDSNLSTAPWVTAVWDNRGAMDILGAGTVGLLNGDSKWSAYLIDKRIDKTGLTDPGDSANPADWVQVRRNSSGDAVTVDGQAKVARIWDGNIDGEWNGWGSGGLRGLLSKDGATDIPARYRTATVDIDMGSVQTIDQLEFGYFFAVDKHRVWISNTPFSWNVELPNSAAILDTTSDAASVIAQGFSPSANPYAQVQAGPFQVYRLTAPAQGRYLRVRQDGSPFGDGHQILLEMRAMSNAALPKPVSGRVIDATGAPVAGAFVGPFPNGPANNYAITAADGTFVWSGPGYPTALYAHVEAKKPDNTYDPTPYLAAGPYYVTPQQGGTNIGDMVVVRSGGNALLGATSIVVSNEGAPGTEAYGPSFCDPSEQLHPTSKLTDGLAGDANQWAAIPNADNNGAPCIGEITTGATYLRVGVESTLAAPADLDEIDIYWFQNGYPAGFYVQTSSDGGTTWNTVYNTTSYAGNYNDGYPGDGLKVSVIKFPTKTGVNKTRVIFSTRSNRGSPDSEFVINEIVGLKHAATPLSVADVTRVLRIAAGLLPAPPTADPSYARLDADGDGKITVLDAVKLDKGLPH
ncbi:MAG TPA: hypothetical protein VGM51_18700 [Armatimonadota bacterium]|jgi:hypothetical protein